VAECQRRGVVHVHALIRLDARDPANPDAILAPPPAVIAHDLGELVASVTAIGFRIQDYPDPTHSWPIACDPQLAVQPIRASSSADGRRM
jgi:hypothetical protein